MTESKLTEQEIEQYHRDGFLLVKGLVDTGMQDDLRNRLEQLALSYIENPDRFPKQTFKIEPEIDINDNYYRQHPMEAIRQIGKVFRLPEFHNYFAPDDSMVQIGKALIGAAEVRTPFMFSFAKPAKHGSAAPWHQDQALWHIWLPTSLTCWIALDPCTRENGCLQFVPGSHRKGMVPHENGQIIQPHSHFDPDEVVYMEMDKGDAVFFDPKTFHASDPNRSPNRRLSFGVAFSADEEVREAVSQREWIHHKFNVKSIENSTDIDKEFPLVQA
jgi:ectoine hydroxylase-related dioxygenase (phytanoyl-CoA dioxygenase family)